MPKRPRPHIIEDLARAALRDTFSRIGWTSEDLAQDYGEDMLVRIFDEGEATPWTFFVQSKATDSIHRFLIGDGAFLSFSIKSDHAKHWTSFWEPVVLAIYDTKSKLTYWEIIQTSLESPHELTAGNPRASLRVHVPVDNVLDDEGVQRLRYRTKQRFERFEAQKVGAQILLEELKSQWGVEISYDPENGVLLLPEGEFRADPAGTVRFIAFGRLAAQFQRIRDQHGVEAQHALDQGLSIMEQVIRGFESGAKLQLRDSTGGVEQEWKSLKSLFHYIDRMSELDQE
jgi:hypothetical protein